MAIALLDNVNQDTVGEFFVWKGGPADIFVTADDFGGGTVTIQRSNDGGAIVVPVKFIDGVTFTATLNSVFPANGWGQGTRVRATLAGATSPVNVRVTV